MDVVLLTACVSDQNTLFRPLGSYQIAWYLRQHGYTAQVVDFLHQLTEEQILKVLEKVVTDDTKIIGLGIMIDLRNPMMGQQIKKFENVMYSLKKRYPKAKIIVGSPSASYFSRFHRNKILFDYVFIGHTEDGVLALADHLFQDAPAPQFEMQDGNRIIREGFTFANRNKFKIENCKHLWADNDYVMPGETLPIELGRGCMFKCKFCQYPLIGKRQTDYNRDMECVKEELINNYNRFGTTNYYMLDDTFNADQERLRAFADMVKTLPFKINYVTYLRLDLIAAHPESEDTLLESGLGAAFFGIESFNKESAKLIDKPWGSKNAKTYLPYLYHDKWKGQVSVRAGFIAGLPPETFPELQETNKWLMDSGLPSWMWFALTLNKDAFSEYRSEFDKNAEQYGFKWVQTDGYAHWKTDYCDTLTAKQWMIQLTNDAKSYQHVAAWQLFELGNFGIDINKAKLSKVIEYNWSDIGIKRKEFLTNYFNRVIKRT